MRKAILVVGGAKRFLDAAREFEAYLRNCEVKHITVIKTAYLEPSELSKELAKALIDQEIDDPLLLAYVGHGGRKGWGISETVVFPYGTLVPILMESEKRILFIQDCCHAFSVVNYLIEANVSEEQMGLIAACGTDEETYPGTIREVYQSWHRNKNYSEHAGEDSLVGEIGDFGYRVKEVGRVRHVMSYALHLAFPRFFPKVSPLGIKLLGLHGERPCVERIEHSVPTMRWGARNFDQFFFENQQIALF